MRVILTHEQADFDALGSQLGAYLLEDSAIPVIPHRLNRNARDFINLYGPELPFLDLRSLPSEVIDSAVLVDTQSLNTIKGMTQATRIEVIDHHPPRPKIPTHWITSFDKVGACTTLFVERLHETLRPINLIEATLLLLGIYEDTGALTYVGTTPRDVRAVAYLLEHGASLRILGEFLNPPLSPEQQSIYDRLLSSAKTFTIHGQKIIITTASGEEMIEEISTVAHKLRDLLDPDVLFLLVHTNEGIRIVARSTTDQVNVAAIANQFGGGGHDRAAGALIHPQDIIPKQNIRDGDLLNYVYEQLIAILPKYVNPPVTVGQLMSRKPQVISINTSAQEALQLMQRYGYEGYPVLKEGKIVGLLTRSVVDRALAHKLNLTAASLMQAGEAAVLPSDPIDHLQQVMASTGWGQIPVIDPQTRKVIGIVTRTDVLKVLANGRTSLPEENNIAGKLESVLSPTRLALLKMIAEKAHQQHLAVYIVGGFVRDLLLDLPSQDFDMVVEGDAIFLARSLSEQYGGRIVSHHRFGTSKWWIEDIRESLCNELTHGQTLDPQDLPPSLDMISARTEFYEHPTALPTVEHSSIKLDLHRRDFTINTLALRLDGQYYGSLYDYWGGLIDLRRGLVRVLHSLSFVDDPTRMLRAVRFEQRFHFPIEERTLQLIDEARTLLHQVTGQRLRHELDLIFLEDHPQLMIERLAGLSLLEHIHPMLRWDPSLSSVFEAVSEFNISTDWQISETIGPLNPYQSLYYLIWLGENEPDVQAQISERLQLPAKLRSALASVYHLRNDLPNLVKMKPSQIVNAFDYLPRIALLSVYLSNRPENGKKLISNYIVHWQWIHAAVHGDDLKTLGINPGPVYSEILQKLRNARLDDMISNDEEERRFFEQLVASIQ
jgi:tRNA nucleotidyltransferase (CCA-adding enzyme)